MDKLIIEFFSEQIQVYKVNNEKKEPFYIKGEESFYWNVSTSYEDFGKLKKEILDILNINDFNEIAIDIVYENIDSESIKNLSQIMLPCAYWQMIDKEKDLYNSKILDMNKVKIENQQSKIHELFDINKKLNEQVEDLRRELAKINNDRWESPHEVNKLTVELNDYKEKVNVVKNWIYSNLEEEYITKEKIIQLSVTLGFIDVSNVAEAIKKGVESVINLLRIKVKK